MLVNIAKALLSLAQNEFRFLISTVILPSVINDFTLFQSRCPLRYVPASSITQNKCFMESWLNLPSNLSISSDHW